MEFYSESFFKDFRSRVPDYEVKSKLNEARSASSYASFDIFLSYNIRDKTVVEGIYLFLTKLGKEVYLDFIVDPQLSRENASKETAIIIRNRLSHSNQLIYAMSCNSAESKWMPWELGIADGEGHKCLILPVSNYYYKDFVRKEYLQLYPILEKQQGYYSYDSYMAVRNSAGVMERFK